MATVAPSPPRGLLSCTEERGEVMLVDRHPDRPKLAEWIGAIPIDDSKGSPVEAILEQTGEEGADCGCECVGYQAHDHEGHEVPSLTMNNLVASFKPTGGIGVVGVFVPKIPALGTTWPRRERSPSTSVNSGDAYKHFDDRDAGCTGIRGDMQRGIVSSGCRQAVHSRLPGPTWFGRSTLLPDQPTTANHPCERWPHVVTARGLLGHDRFAVVDCDRADGCPNNQSNPLV